MEGKGTGWNNVFLPHALRPKGETPPCRVISSGPAHSSCIEGSMGPGLAEGEQLPAGLQLRH